VTGLWNLGASYQLQVVVIGLSLFEEIYLYLDEMI
jgi:hypothetical protein